MDFLNIYMNGYLVGRLKQKTNGSHWFIYEKTWLETKGARPISLSLPLKSGAYKGAEVINFFDNLLPDNRQIRERIVARYQARSTQPYDLLFEIGRDCIGALQLIPGNLPTPDIHKVEAKLLDTEGFIRIINGYKNDIPLGMLKQEDDFRISIAGVQEKTALLYQQGNWFVPHGATPTTHIIKLPIGIIPSHSHTLDLRDSVENEWLCMLVAREFGFAVPDCQMITIGDSKVLSVARFDRRPASDGTWIIRLPQEDFCQILNIPSARKYESDGGPGISDIMAVLLGSDNVEQDRETFMRSQVLFWLLAASDGHAKNFSVYIGPNGGYTLTPLYDIMSCYPMIGGQGLAKQDIKMAMSLASSKGQNRKNLWHRLFPRHFIATARSVGFSVDRMKSILLAFQEQTPAVVQRVVEQLPADFPEHISKPILAGIANSANRLGYL